MSLGATRRPHGGWRRSRAGCATASSAWRCSSRSSPACCWRCRASGRRGEDHGRAVGLGGGRHRAGGALVHLLRGAVRAGVRAPGPQPEPSPLAGGAGRQLGRVRERAGGNRAGRVGAEHQGCVGGEDRKALGVAVRDDQRGERVTGGGDRGADVAGVAAGLAQPAADAAAGGGGAGDDPRHAGGRALGAPGGGAAQRRAAAAWWWRWSRSAAGWRMR